MSYLDFSPTYVGEFRQRYIIIILCFIEKNLRAQAG